MKYQYMIVELGHHSITNFITEDDWNDIVNSYDEESFVENGIDLTPNGDGITVIDQEEQIVLKVPVT